MGQFFRKTEVIKPKPKPDWAGFIVDHGRTIEIIFIIFTLLNGLFFFFVKVNYDLSVYLPSDAPSKKGLVLMEKEFGYPGSARLMLQDVSLYEAKIYKDKIASLSGVNMVVWADTFVDIYQAAEFIDYSIIGDYYRDGCAAIDIIFKAGDSAEQTYETIDQIQKICGSKGFIAGPAAQSKALGETLNREMTFTMVFAVLMIFLILFLTTRSWFEPVLFMLVIIISIIINMGSNIILGEISFLTFSVAPVLQLAIAIDYSIFLLNAYAQEKKKGLETREAMIGALRNSSKSIISSCAAAIVGFLVMAVMEFRIGWDIGLVLAKGIFIALITITLLMPALVMRWDALIDRTLHRSFMPSFHRLGAKVYKYRAIPIIVVALLLIPAYVGQSMCDFTYGTSGMLGSPGVKLYDDEQKIYAHFDRSNLVCLLVPNGSIVSERNLQKDLESRPYVKSVICITKFLPEGIPVSILPSSLTGMFHNDKYVRLLVNVRGSEESELAFKAMDDIRSITRHYYPRGSYVVGMSPSTQDIKRYIVKDYELVDFLAILGVALTVAVAFKSLSLPIIVMVPIKAAFFINMTLQYIGGQETMYMGYIIVGCLQLGATIDYSILLTDKYLEARAYAARKQAAVLAVEESALSVFTSGFILAVCGYGLYFISSVSAIGVLGKLIGQGALCSMALSIGLLPGLLYYTDPIFRGDIRKKLPVWQATVQKSIKDILARRKKGRTSTQLEELPEEAES